MLRQAEDPSLFGHVHVIFGGTGAVGGATALQMISLYEEAAAHKSVCHNQGPRIVITGRTKAEVRQFTAHLYSLQKRDHGKAPVKVPGVGYRTATGVIVELRVLSIDPSVSGLRDFARLSEEQRREAVDRFLEKGKLRAQAPLLDKLQYLKRAIRRRVGRPFSAFLRSYRDEQGLGEKRFRSVVVGIPLASIAAYKLNDLDEAGPYLGLEHDSPEMAAIKHEYLLAIRNDLAEVKAVLSDEVLVAHTTAVGGMFDEDQSGQRRIRLGFAHSALDENLRNKQEFAEELARLYAERRIKMLITAAAIGGGNVRKVNQSNVRKVNHSERVGV